jgi:anti-anti-sigma factor
MKAKIKKIGDTVVVCMDGRIDYDTNEPLKKRLSDLSKQISRKNQDSVSKVIFNFEKLEFVGSSGISSFVQTLREFNLKATTKPRYCNVRSEFKKVIRAFDEEELFEFYDDENDAQRSFNQ